MFLIMGINQGEKKLDFVQTLLCPCCGRYGSIAIYTTYMYFSLFFIPLFRWGRKYFAVTSCCGSRCEIDRELGRKIQKGEVSQINLDELRFEKGACGMKRCAACGYSTEEDFQFCPKCGKPF